MADPTIPIGHRDGVTLLEYLLKVGVDLEGDFLSQGTQFLAQLAIEFEAEQQIGAGRYPGRTPGRCERSPERTTYRNGHRERVWETRVGEIPLRIPKLREGSYLPSLLEQRRRAEKALLAVVQAAYVQGVSTRKVDELLQALGLTGIDTPALAGGARESKVSRICRELDVFVDAFRNRPLEGSYPNLWLDALYLKVRHTVPVSCREDHRIVSQALIVSPTVVEVPKSSV